jgi:hypothetical protein
MVEIVDSNWPLIEVLPFVSLKGRCAVTHLFSIGR